MSNSKKRLIIASSVKYDYMSLGGAQWYEVVTDCLPMRSNRSSETGEIYEFTFIRSDFDITGWTFLMVEPYGKTGYYRTLPLDEQLPETTDHS